MSPQQPEGMSTGNKHVTTSPQRQQYDLIGVGNKSDCFLFDVFQNKVSQLEKEISKKDEIISFLTEQLSVKNVNAFTISPNFSAELKSRKKCELKSSQ